MSSIVAGELLGLLVFGPWPGVNSVFRTAWPGY
jgi:hypothetical protein